MATWRAPEVNIEGTIVPPVEGTVTIRDTSVRHTAKFTIDVASIVSAVESLAEAVTTAAVTTGRDVEELAAEYAAVAVASLADDAAVGDARPFDTRPNACWRCDAAEGDTDVGLCGPCHADLTS